ncbi:MAG TPA: class I SAM-dependent methyltransferase [Terriglobales bacterium]|nr:class I SAM-dependent methyltransferase [Terriglobales bacterium]
MSDKDRGWDQRYSEDAHGPSQPDDFLLRAWNEHILPRFPVPGSALDVAGGLGRHALWVASQGWQVTLVDSSEVAIARAQAAAAQRGLMLNAVAADLRRYELGNSRFHVILVFFYLERALFPALENALCPGGILLYKTYTREQLRFAGGPRNPEHLLTPGELGRAFPRLQVLDHRETLTERAVAEFAGLRPVQA